MPIFDFFRNLFGIKPSQQPPQYRLEDDPQYRDSFRNPIWQNDEEEDDVSDFGRHPGNRYQFRIFSDPFEMTRFFESQMDDMMRTFFGGFGGLGSGFGNNTNIFLPFESDDFSNELPMIDDKSSPKGPRDEVLKPSYDSPKSNFDDFTSIFTIPNGKLNDTRVRDEVLKPSYEMPSLNSKKLDSDVDGKIPSGELAKIWQTPDTSKSVERFSSPFSIRSFGNSVSRQIVRMPDGSIEQRHTVRDSDGNEEITVTRQIGDKVHTVITKRAIDGSETKKEDIINMDENELKGFDEKWTRIQGTPNIDRADNIPWYKFFGFNPKL